MLYCDVSHMFNVLYVLFMWVNENRCNCVYSEQKGAFERSSSQVCANLYAEF